MIMRTTTIHCVAGANPSIDRASGENPPVAADVSPWATAWYGVMRSSTPVKPSTASTTQASIVRPT